MNEETLRKHVLHVIRFNADRTLSTADPSRFQVGEDDRLRWCIDPSRRDPYYNRVLGFDADAIPRLEQLLAVYAEAGVAPQFDLEPAALCSEVSQALISHGFAPRLSLAFLQRELLPHEAPRVCVERWGPERADEFLALMSTSGARCEPAVWAVQRRHYCTDTFRTFVAVIDGRPCAWATSFVDGGAAYLANAYTQDDLRRRGAHTALLRARLTDAAELGLETAWTDVEWGSDSHRNCTRAGFDLLTVHTHWMRED